MVTWRSITNLTLGALLVLTLAGAGAAGAQQAKPRVTPAGTSAGAQAQADAAAREAVRGGNKPSAASQDFLTEQALRAEAIRKQAEGRTDEAAFYAQEAEVAKQRKAQAQWVQDQHRRAQGIADAAIESGEQMAGMGPDKKPKRPQYLVFLSQSMGATAIKQALEYGRGRPEIGYVFRGFLPGQSPMQFYGALAKFQGKAPGEISLVMLDPPAFRNFSVAQVPAIVSLDENEKLVAKVTGLVNPGWLGEQVASGRRGDLGTQGQVYRIGETDLLEAMKAKAASLDLRQEAEDAKKRFFQELATIDLPYAREKRVRTVVPQLVVKQDVVDHTGRVRFRAGDKVSMQEHLRNAPVLVIFNSQDPYHVAFAKNIIAKSGNKKVILMTTRIDRKGGIPNYARQEAAIGRPVYLLMDDVKRTFGIENIPTVVTPTDKEFVVVEVPLAQGVSGNGNAGHKSP